MTIEKNKVVSLSYQLEVGGQIADKADAGNPLEYIHGTGMLLPRFEEEVVGKNEGDSFEFVLSPEEGYGSYEEKYVLDIPMAAFEVDGEVKKDLLAEGRMLPMLNSEGQVVSGLIVKVGEESVTMDFNHPMAGKTLHFSGKVEAVRDATEKELLEGLHGEYLPHGCGHCGGECHCGDGECGEGNCGGDGCGCHGEGHGDECGCHGEGHGDECGCHGEGHGKGHCHNS